MSWPTKALGEICDLEIGKTPSRANPDFWRGGTLPWLSIADMNQGRHLRKTKECVTEAGAKAARMKLVSSGTLVLSYKLSIGKVGFVETPLFTNEAIAALSNLHRDVDAGFLYWALQHIDLLEGADRAAMGNTLNKAKLEKVRIPLPSVPEQRRIAAILDKADALRAKRRLAIAKLDQLLQSVFLEMFGDPVTNPKGWSLCSVDDLCTLVRGSSPRPQGDPRFFGGPVPRLMVADLTRDGWFVTPRIDSLTVEGAARSRPTKAGTVVMAVSGNVGLASILAIDACIHDGFVGFSRLDESKILPRVLLMNLHFLKQTHHNITAGAIFQNLTTTDIKKIALPIPPMEAQKRFVDALESILKHRQHVDHGCQQMERFWSSAQSWAFSGAH